MFGITLPAFEIAGGVILLLIGIDMIEARRSPTQESSDETAEATSKEDAGIVPLGIPMLAGPGAISSVMILVGQALKPWELGVVLGAITLTAGLSYMILSGANRVRGWMGESGIRILVRIMGLLLVALAVQFFINGLTDLGVIAEIRVANRHLFRATESAPKSCRPEPSTQWRDLGSAVRKCFPLRPATGNNGCPTLAFWKGGIPALPPKFSLFNSSSPFSTTQPLALLSTCYSHRGR